MPVLSNTILLQRSSQDDDRSSIIFPSVLIGVYVLIIATLMFMISRCCRSTSQRDRARQRTRYRRRQTQAVLARNGVNGANRFERAVRGVVGGSGHGGSSPSSSTERLIPPKPSVLSLILSYLESHAARSSSAPLQPRRPQTAATSTVAKPLPVHTGGTRAHGVEGVRNPSVASPSCPKKEVAHKAKGSHSKHAGTAHPKKTPSQSTPSPSLAIPAPTYKGKSSQKSSTSKLRVDSLPSSSSLNGSAIDNHTYPPRAKSKSNSASCRCSHCLASSGTAPPTFTLVTPSFGDL